MTTIKEQDPHMERDPLIGAVVAGYRIESLVGHGGMGVVYRAIELHTGERAALKVMVPEIARNPEFRERFVREAESGIDHPNIVPIYKSGEEDGLLYIAMRLIEGEDLKSLVTREGRLLPARVVSIFTQAASALDAAHENGVVHRDVKPQNILIEPGSEDDFELVYLSDFGLVKRVSSQSSFTTSTYLMGSVQYMAPEQIEGKRVDGRSDVYSLGCVLYESLTGSVPFPKETEVAVLWAHMNESPPPVSSLVPVLGTSVDQVIAKAMAKSPDERYLTAGEMTSAAALELGISTRRARSPWGGGIASTGRRRKLVIGRKPQSVADRLFPQPVSRFKAAIVGGLATLLALGGASFVELRDSEPDEPSSLDVIAALESPNAPGSREILKEAAEKLPGIARRDPADVGLLVPERPVTGEEQNLPPLIDAAGEAPAPAQESAPGQRPVFRTPSISEIKIAFHTTRHDQTDGYGGEIYVMNGDGTHPSRLTHNDPIMDYESDWSPDNSKIAFISDRGGNFDVFVMDADGTNVKRLTDTPRDCDTGPRWSPDGLKIAYSTTCDFSVEDGEIWVMDADGSNKVNLTKTPSTSEGYQSWSPDGRKMAFVREGELYIMNSDGTGARPLTVPSPEYGRPYAPDWGPNGKIAFNRFMPPPSGDTTTNTDVFVVNTDGTGHKRLTDTARRDQWPSWSPDGSKIVYWRQGVGGGEIFMMDPDGTDQTNMTRAPSNENFPMWQNAYYKEMTLRIEGNRAVGGLRSFYAPCAWYQPIAFQRKVASRWKTVAKTASDTSGSFGRRFPREPGTYRVKAALSVTERGILCAPAVSRAVVRR